MNKMKMYSIVGAAILFNYVAFAMEKPPLVQLAASAIVQRLLVQNFTQVERVLSSLPDEVKDRIQNELIKKYGFLALEKCGVPEGERRIAGVGSIESVAMNPQGTLALSGSIDGAIVLYDLRQTPFVETTLRERGPAIQQVGFSPDGRFAVVASRYLHIWEIEDDSIKRHKPKRQHHENITAMAWSNDSRFLVTGGQSGMIKLWDFQKRPIVAEDIPGHTDIIRKLALSPNGSFALSASTDGTFRYWDLRKRPITSQVLLDGQIIFFTLSPDGRVALSAGLTQDEMYLHEIRLWDFTKAPISSEVLEERTPYITSDMQFSADGNFVFMASSEQHEAFLSKWDLRSRPVEKYRIKAHDNSIKDMEISADGKRALTIGIDRVVKLWDISKVPFKSVQLGYLKTAMGGPSKIALNADGTLALAGDKYGNLWAWDLNKSLRTLTPLQMLLVVRLLLGQDLSGDSKAQEIKNSITTLLCPAIDLWGGLPEEPTAQTSASSGLSEEPAAQTIARGSLHEESTGSMLKKSE